MAADPARSELGVSQLNALGDSEVLDEGQQLFVDAALAAVVEDAAEEVEQAGLDTVVVRASDSITLADASSRVIRSDPETEPEDVKDVLTSHRDRSRTVGCTQHHEMQRREPAVPS